MIQEASNVSIRSRTGHGAGSASAGCVRERRSRANEEAVSRRDDVTLANPLGPPARGWNQVEKTLEHAASQLREGKAIRFERISEFVTGNLAYIVEIERYRGKVGGAEEIAPNSLRATTIFRREDVGWRIVHCHADPITGTRPIESILEQ